VPSVSVQTDCRKLRRDAQANRERIISAAAEAFAEHGLEASVEEIARRAGVGMGTLYRRFPSKRALVDAIFEAHLEQLVLIAHRALDESDGWEGFCRFLEQAVALQADNRGFAEIVAVHLRDEALLTRARARVVPPLRRLIERAQAAGELRPDVVYQDVSVLLWTTGRVVEATREIAPHFWRRHLALALDGLRTTDAQPLPEPALTIVQHRKAMERLAEQLHLAPLTLEKAH
jgi:AcrR family transcriptional regulator